MTEMETGNGVENLEALPRQKPAPEPAAAEKAAVYPGDVELPDDEAEELDMPSDDELVIDHHLPALHTMESPLKGEPGSPEWFDSIDKHNKKIRAATLAAGGVVAVGGLKALRNWFKERYGDKN